MRSLPFYFIILCLTFFESLRPSLSADIIDLTLILHLLCPIIDLSLSLRVDNIHFTGTLQETRRILTLAGSTVTVWMTGATR